MNKRFLLIIVTIKLKGMKTKNLMTIFTTLLMTVLSMVYSFGQTTTAPTQPSTATPHNVGINSTHIYDVAYTVRGATPNQYTWIIYTADGTYTKGPAAVSGTDYTIAVGATAAIQNIVWLKAGHYVIELQEADPAANGSCSGVLQSLNVNVGPTGTVEFLNSTGTNQCPATGGYALDLSYTGTISYPIAVSVEYTINGSTSTATINVADAVTQLSIPVLVGFLNNTTTTDDIARSVRITGVKDSFGGDLTISTKDTHTLTIWSLPATTPIHHD
jgi:hypothetical protein